MATDWRLRMLGTDPFDALRGRRVPAWVRSHPRARQMVIQARKRFPWDTSGLLGVDPFLMAKTAGSFLSARSRAAGGSPDDCAAIALLMRSTEGCLGEGRWGYEFDVQTRWAYYPAGSSNLIATVFCARGFGEAGVACSRQDWVAELHGSAAWVADALFDDERRIVRYVPGNDRLVHNANALGAGLLAFSGAVSGDQAKVRMALDAARTTVEAQRQDGGWPYGEGPSLAWEDNFHTAYTLDGLLQVWLATGDSGILESLEQGARRWETAYFASDGAPLFGPGRRYPLDIHSAGTAVDVASRLSTWGVMGDTLARSVAGWTRAHLVDPVTGCTRARVLRFGIDRRHFPRWGDAHWALGESALGLVDRDARVALEERVMSSRVSGEAHSY